MCRLEPTWGSSLRNVVGVRPGNWEDIPCGVWLPVWTWREIRVQRGAMQQYAWALYKRQDTEGGSMHLPGHEAVSVE